MRRVLGILIAVVVAVALAGPVVAARPAAEGRGHRRTGRRPD